MGDFLESCFGPLHPRPAPAPAAQYLRLARHAARHGDPHSARIYQRQALDHEEDVGFVVGDHIDLPGAGPARYSWENKGPAGTSRSGLELYRWYDPDAKQTRVQHAEPGTGREKSRERTAERRRKKAEEEQARAAAPPALETWGAEARARLEQAAARFFPGEEVAAHLPRLTGAPPGSTVRAAAAPGSPWDGSLERIDLEGDHPAVRHLSRSLKLQEDGSLVMHNNLFFLKKKYRQTGMGLRAFGDQVRALALAGVDRIETCAGRGGIMNGYYTWPRLGYDADLSDRVLSMLHSYYGPDPKGPTRGGPSRRVAAALAKAGVPEGEVRARVRAVLARDPRTVLDLMETADGRAIWKGVGEMCSMRFDLSPGSRSLRTLNDYLAGKGLAPIEVPEHARQANAARRRQREQYAHGEAQLRREQREARQRQYEERHQKWWARGAEVAAAAGLDAGELWAAAWAVSDWPGRHGIAPGGDRFDVMGRALEVAAGGMLRNRAADRLLAPEGRAERLREAEAAARGASEGLGLPIHEAEVMRRALENDTAGRGADAGAAVRAAYREAARQAAEEAAGVLEAMRRSGADGDFLAEVRRRYGEAIRQRRERPELQYGGHDPGDLLRAIAANVEHRRRQDAEKNAAQHARHYARLAHQALARGDRASARIYARQARHYEARHAPAGGVTIGGTFYRGGEFIPGDVVATATPQERAKLEGSAPRGLLGKIKAAVGLGHKHPGLSGGQRQFSRPEESRTVQDIVSGAAAHDLHHGLPGGREDTALNAILEESGRAAPPQRASATDIDELARAGWYVCHRGVGEKAHAEQFVSGELYNGAGIYGNGTYFAFEGRVNSGGKARAIAAKYARGGGPEGAGATMRVAFPPGARIAEHDALKAEQVKFLNGLTAERFAGKMPQAEYERAQALYSDLGRYAALHNYDAIRVSGDGYLCILNRTKCVVEA